MKQFWSKSLACLLCLALLAGMLPVAALAEDNPPANGEVSLADAATNTPIVISSVENLKKIGTEPGYPMDGSYVLTEDIDLGGEETPWTSIGYGGKSFTGTFDGAGHTISGLYLNFSSIDTYRDQGLGLFTSVGQDGSVKNLTVKGEIDGTNAGVGIGGIVGRNDGGTISNCTSSVDITGSVNSNVGGIVGSGDSGTIENCCNTGSINVTCSNSDIGIGGIVGKTSNGTVKTCENTGNVTVDYCTGTGGIVGYAVGGSKVSNCRNSGSIDGNKSKTGGIVGENYGAVLKCYNTGDVRSDGTAGGITGRNVSENGGSGSTVENCYNIGDVSGSDDVGGIVGYNNNSNYYKSTVKNCYNTGKVTGTGKLGGAVGRIETGDVSDCYYLRQEGLPGIGSGTGETGTNIIPKTAGQFASGEVAWLLQRWQNEQNGQVWGQQLTGESVDPHPVLTDEKNLSVLQVTFKDGAEGNNLYAYGYANSGAPVANWPADPTPSDGQYFAGWKDSEGKDFTAQTNVTSDNISVTASFGTIEQLASPTGLAWSGTAPGQATWSAVTNASGYTVQLYKDGSA